VKSLPTASPEQQKRHVRLRLAWLVLGLFFAVFSAYELSAGRAHIRRGHKYARESEPAMFWLVISIQGGLAAWFFWKAATQRIESNQK